MQHLISIRAIALAALLVSGSCGLALAQPAGAPSAPWPRAAQLSGGAAMLVLAAILWGSTFVIIKDALADITPVLYLLIRFSLSSLLLLSFSLDFFVFVVVSLSSLSLSSSCLCRHLSSCRIDK